LTISGLTLTGGTTAYVYILKPDGTTLATSVASGAGGFIDVQTLPVTGSYTVQFNPIGTAVGSATLQLYDVPSSAAGTIDANGPPVTVTTTAPGQSVNLTFTSNASQQATVRATNNAMGAVKISLIRPDGTTLTYAISASVSFNLSTQTLPVTGSYTVSIDPSGTNVGSISVNVTSP
jgi:hypothetical protein